MANSFKENFWNPGSKHYKLHFFLYVLVLAGVFGLLDAVGLDPDKSTSSVWKVLYFFVANLVAEIVVTVVITLIDRRNS